MLFKNCYFSLGVSPKARKHEIEEAYWYTVFSYAKGEEGEKDFLKVLKSYAVLSDERKRRKHDDFISESSVLQDISNLEKSLLRLRYVKPSFSIYSLELLTEHLKYDCTVTLPLRIKISGILEELTTNKRLSHFAKYATQKETEQFIKAFCNCSAYLNEAGRKPLLQQLKSLPNVSRKASSLINRSEKNIPHREANLPPYLILIALLIYVFLTLLTNLPKEHIDNLRSAESIYHSYMEEAGGIDYPLFTPEIKQADSSMFGR